MQLFYSNTSLKFTYFKTYFNGYNCFKKIIIIKIFVTKINIYKYKIIKSNTLKKARALHGI